MNSANKPSAENFNINENTDIKMDAKAVLSLMNEIAMENEGVSMTDGRAFRVAKLVELMHGGAFGAEFEKAADEAADVSLEELMAEEVELEYPDERNIAL